MPWIYVSSAACALEYVRAIKTSWKMRATIITNIKELQTRWGIKLEKKGKRINSKNHKKQ